MRKMVFAVMALAMVVSMVGCGGDKPATPPPTMTPTTPATTPTSTK